MRIGWIEFDVLQGDVHSLKKKRSAIRPFIADLSRRTECAAKVALERRPTFRESGTMLRRRRHQTSRAVGVRDRPLPTSTRRLSPLLQISQQMVAHDLGQKWEARRDGAPEKIKIEQVVVMDDVVAISSRLPPNRLGEAVWIGGHEALREISDAIRQRLERKRHRWICSEVLMSSRDQVRRGNEGVLELLKPSSRAVAHHRETASRRIPASRMGSSESTDTADTRAPSSTSMSSSN